MHVHILGICGTFMGGLALLARGMGHKVTGSDANVYPPMSTQLEQQGIELIQGFDPVQLGKEGENQPDLVVIGNAMSRGNPCVEAVLNRGIKYTSGPQFLSEYILPERWVLAVSGTHGKTSTSSMLAWVLEYCGYEPGFLIGGVPQNFGVSARLGNSPFFVVEADEYDSAFFDKRSKFVHYRPRTLVVNNLEFDHADIFADLAAIQRQFNHVIRTVPSEGKVIWPAEVEAVKQVIELGCWSEQEHFYATEHSATGWYGKTIAADGHEFEVKFNGESQGILNWGLIGQHNIENAIMAIAAARHVGVAPSHAIEALSQFAPPKRRLELLDTVNGIAVYDDFAHHPTAIETTLQGLRAKVGEGDLATGKLIVVLEPRSNTMKSGVHKDTLAASMALADCAFLYQADNVGWDLKANMASASIPVAVFTDIDAIIAQVKAQAQSGDTVVIMSNGGFHGIHQQLINALK
ncbi:MULTISPECIES: UDP-N-acetylmuramate:L-alanyl-gamma-D-glutamyl-meso-diaminopimelate ligase [unclassified Shewanella]|uniref:UDP-N-acetylmuramate:L-alanyl-gamma-D-glutamyl- meso-diaminopimelate ligase n=1 Tax=unclassified Shewanella TaxID=196818 RepID=UPI000C836581|nr:MULTISPECIES: UDP-N-acetylmuramate:L-alanyl-gamma-D-glutamyl-meso-diaminopimelate ligase [unclassified Shewanella]MDO6617992.1 UDP-N-acetylmuramate:L-alanyl-gamma-D-glutamyl-meso-diaminopimelate ligase [Shewanella sp. 6_MG-2023]MDO6679155.1 UDP-N-acetylmuramate:L-alanyl-gamma-D-glutamyl-meso-diaminopimelate ligase [Shewanella sp. 4_MG-2023]PMG30748.1 UDP-N-acetylmuramate:L-alanyl-gamma-D-glutamyl-meso-diaminopimelate ligase [Shewanella sp. 10N.286.52.C2]PMH84882.1 UDP-N-acetylmuramate:L-alan